MSSLPDNAPRPRLCHVTKWAHFDGFGFNLHAEKSKPGQYIGKVDKDSPAEAAGLKQGDRIIEVNGANISMENHKQVVQRIKAVPNETRLLVVDLETDSYFKERDLVVKGNMKCVDYISSDQRQNISNLMTTTKDDLEVFEPRHDDEDRRSLGSSASAASSTEKKPFSSSTTSGSSPRSTPSPEPGSLVRSGTRSNWDGLNLNMTAKEMREKIGAKKKRDPRKDDRMDFRKKFEIIGNL